jgi:ketosteroid isomerase-like protein
MRRTLLLSLLLICTAAPAIGASAKPPKADAGDTVKAAELARFEAAQKNDLEALGKLLADDLTYTHSTGRLETKAAFLESLKSGKLQFKKIEPADLQVRVYGTTVVINGTAKMSVVNDGQAKDIALRFTDVWVNRAGHWQMVAWQSSKTEPVVQK